MDSLSFLKDFTEPLQKLEELFLQSRRAFLMGAGCSKCAGLPLTAELTQKAIDSSFLDTESKEVLTAIKIHFDGSSPPAHIEDYLSELIDLLSITERRQYRKSSNQTIQVSGKNYTTETLTKAVEQIKKAIAAEINIQVDIEIHKKFSEINHRTTRPGKNSGNQTIDYIVLNYDTLLEDALALSCVPFADGMDGGVTGWWDHNVFDRKDLSARVFKMHGSINWHEFPNESLPRRVASSVKIPGMDENRILIWPASTKYRETQLDPYAQITERVRRVLNPAQGLQRVLVICGYSFGDSHINIEIENGLRNSSGELTVVVFTDQEQPIGVLKEWHEDKSISKQILIYAKKGFYHEADVKTSVNDLTWWKFENLVRILDGER